MTVLFLQLGNSSRWLASARCMMHDMNHTVVTIMMWRFLHKDGHLVDSLNLQWPSSYSFDLSDRLTCSPCRCALSKFISWHRRQQLPGQYMYKAIFCRLSVTCTYSSHCCCIIKESWNGLFLVLLVMIGIHGDNWPPISLHYDSAAPCLLCYLW